MKPGPVVAFHIGTALRWAALMFLVPIPVAFLLDARAGLVPATVPLYMAGGALCAATGQAIRWAAHGAAEQEASDRHTQLAIAGTWLLGSVFAAVPFLAVAHPVEAWFESMSGITTTGATIFADFDAVPASLFFWRSLLQWVAGFAVVVVGVAVLARLTHGGKTLLAATASIGRKLRPRIGETARAMLPIYALFSAVTFLGYVLTMRYTGTGAPWRAAIFDAAIHTFSTVSTGGFSNHRESLAYYESIWVEGVAVGAMLVAGTSFALMFYVRRRPLQILKNAEWRATTVFFTLASVGAVGLLVLSGDGFLESLRAGVVTIVSIGTSTGYMVVDHDSWPTLARSLLIITMFSGAMAASASGGMKVLRILILLKVARREIRKLLHPRAIIATRHGGKPLPEQTLLAVIAFFFTYVTTWMVGALILIATEPSLGIFDGAAAAAAAIGNTGPAMGVVGPFDDYSVLHTSSHITLSILMWVGRLEVFAALLFLSPSSWR